MSRVIVYGVGRSARVAAYYLSQDSPCDVVAFASPEPGHAAPSPVPGVPALDTGAILAEFPPTDCQMFVAMENTHLNAEREQAFLHARELGYELVSYVSSKATIWPDAQVGVNCMILERTIIQPFAEIGDDVTLSPGCHIGHESIIGDHCFLAARSAVAGKVHIGERVYMGPNSTVRDAITVAPDTHIGAATTILKTTQTMSVYRAPSPELLSVRSDRLIGDAGLV